jgi:site-specific DNA-methyltransferase (adenine-specific)
MGDVVLDPFGGTMTTAVVAKKTGRDYIAIEKEKEYCDYGAKRIEQAQTEIGDIEKAVFDVAPPKVGVADMIKQHYLVEYESFYLKDQRPYATLLPDAKLKYNDTVLDMHTCAAAACGKKANRVNGFDYWYVCRDGHFVSLAAVRERFRREQLNFW